MHKYRFNFKYLTHIKSKVIQVQPFQNRFRIRWSWVTTRCTRLATISRSMVQWTSSLRWNALTRDGLAGELKTVRPTTCILFKNKTTQRDAYQWKCIGPRWALKKSMCTCMTISSHLFLCLLHHYC